MNKGIKTLALAALAFAGVSANAADVFVTADITGNVTWTSGNVYYLQDVIFVRDGGKLTINEGTVVRGQPRTAGSFNPGTLVVTISGTIDAVGSPTDPIIFTSAVIDENNDGAADDLSNAGGQVAGDGFFDRYDGSAAADALLDSAPKTSPLPFVDGLGGFNRGLWGGLIVLGEAPTNVTGIAGAGVAQNFIEGLPQDATGIYGGFNPNDNSGELAYISIRHGGTNLAADNEINGLTCGGVGFGTRIDHIDVYCNLDDGCEMFGGTANLKFFTLTYNSDESFDLDEGYTGLVQFMLIITSTESDYAIEADGEQPGNATPLPLAWPTIYNMTIYGPTASQGMRNRQNFGMSLLNSIIVLAKGTPMTDIEDTSESIRLGDTLIYRENTWFYYDAVSADDFGPADLADNAAEEVIWDGSDPDMTDNLIRDPGFVANVTADFGDNSPNLINPVPARVTRTYTDGTQNTSPLAYLAGTLGEPYTSTFFDPVSYKGACTNVSSAIQFYAGWAALEVDGTLVTRGSDS